MKNVRSNIVKESLLDYESLAKTIKENTSSAVKDLLSEAVRETYAKILSEEDENEYDEEVNDTESLDTNDAEETVDSVDTDVDDTVDGESEVEATTDAEETTEVTDEPIEGENETVADDGLESASDSETDEWAEFDKYKVGDDEYDFSQADDDEIVKVYKRLKDDDQVMVTVDNNKVSIKDNEAGTEYLVDLGSEEGESEEVGDIEADGDLNFEGNMSESRIFEIALNEYDSHVGYTDNYQSKDVMTNPGTSEPGKNVNDWDAGVPKGDSKPWSSISHKKDDKPFNGENGKKVEECGDTDGNVVTEEDAELEEATNVGGFVQQNSTSKSHVPNSNGRKARNMSKDGVKKSGTPNPRYSSVEESKMLAKVNKIMKENNELKKALGKFKTVLQEAAVTNLNLGQIIKLISENSTTKAEKQEIIARFGKEAKTVQDSNKLYESISNELKKKNVMDINEDRQFTTNGSKMINETQIYKSEDLMQSLDLMHRLCK